MIADRVSLLSALPRLFKIDVDELAIEPEVVEEAHQLADQTSS
jgi:hypothetical protein